MLKDELKKQLIAICGDVYGKDVDYSSSVDAVISKYLKPDEAILDNNYKNTRSSVDTETLVNDIMTDPKITLTGQAVMYDKTIENVCAVVLDELASKRNYWKGIMFDNINTNPKRSKRADLFQVNYKEFSNSYYGISLNEGSIFYNKYNGLAVTSSGQTAIMTAIISMESMFGNQSFTNFSDLLVYINEVKANATNDILPLLDVDMIKTQDQVIEFIKPKCMFALHTTRLSLLKSVLQHMTENELNHLFYRNNFYQFIKNTYVAKIINAILGYDINVKTYLKGKSDDEKTQKGIRLMNALMQILHDFVIMYRLPSEKYKIVNLSKRRTIIHTDTDSVFIYLHPFVNYCNAMNRNDRYNNLNLITVIFSKYIANSLLMLSERMKTSEANKTRLEMKNEFLFKKIIMTKNKKNYICLPEVKEGRKIAKPEVDIKGLTIKKSTLHKTVRDFFASIVDDELFNPNTDNIDIHAVLKKIFDFKNYMKSELLGGSTEYSSTLKLNNIDSYKNPYTQQVVRGSIVWNALYPENPIQNSQKCGSYAMTGLETEDGLDKIQDVVIREKIREVVFKNDNMKDRGVVVLTFPKNVKSVPEWAREFINIDAIIEKNMANINPIMDALGIYIYDKGGTGYITSVVDIK